MGESLEPYDVELGQNDEDDRGDRVIDNNKEDIAKCAINLVLGEDNDYLQRLLTDQLNGRERVHIRIPISKLVEGTDRSQLRNKLTRETIIARQNAVDSLKQRFIPPKSATISEDKSGSSSVSRSGSFNGSEIKHKHRHKHKHASDHCSESELEPTSHKHRHKLRKLEDQILLKDQKILEQEKEIISLKSHLKDSQTSSSWILNTVLQEKLKDREVRESSDYWKYINGALALILPVVTGLVEYFLTDYLKKCNNGSS